MTARVLLLVSVLLACLLCATRPQAAPVVSEWECRQFLIWNDTLAHGANDSVSTTLAVPAQGARYVQLLISSTGSDSILGAILQTRLPGGRWTGTGGVFHQPYSGLNINPAPAAGLLFQPNQAVTGRTVAYWAADNEPTVGASFAMPMVNDSLRWRIKGNPAMLRLYANNGPPAIATNGGSTGIITVRAFVWY